MSSSNAIQVKQRRLVETRSRKACHFCRQRHVKCDGNIPVCNHCNRFGRACWAVDRAANDLSKDTSRSLSALTYNPDWTQIESITFNIYAFAIAPLIGEPLDLSFWIDVVLSAARTETAVFAAVLANTAFWSIPVTKLLQLERCSSPRILESDYRNAIQWYDQSLGASSIASLGQSDMCTVLIGCIMYCYTECRLGHFDKAQTLIKSAFAWMHSSKKMSSLQGSTALASLVQLLRLSTYGAIDCSEIPRSHRNTAMVHTLRIASEIGTTESFLIRVEFQSLLWNLADTLSGQVTDVDEFDAKINAWVARCRIHQRNTGEKYVISMWQYYQAQWQAYKNGLRSNRILLEHCLDALYRQAESIVEIDQAAGKELMPLIESEIIPTCIFICWYWRKESTFIRMSAMLGKSPCHENLIRRSLDYMRELVGTDYGNATRMELEIFGEQPKYFTLRHAYLSAIQLVDQISRSIPGP